MALGGARVSFLGGVGVIGSSKVMVEQDGYRVLLDMGLDYQPGAGLYREGVVPRAALDRRLKDRLKTGGAPWISHFYRPEAVAGLDLEGGSDGRTALFITHGHLDHMGLTGFVDPGVPIRSSPDTARLIRLLAESGDAVEGVPREFLPIPAGEPVDVGPMRVTRYDVDHDVPGASGYSVETQDGVLAFSGDIRLHGRHPDRSLGFARAVHGARALVIEGTTLSAGFRGTARREEQVEEAYLEALRSHPGVVLFTAYVRNTERMAAFLDAGRAAGREVLWPPREAAFLSAWLGREVGAWDDGALARVAADPNRFALRVQPENLPSLLDLPPGSIGAFVHANGEPLGPYDPRYQVVRDWMEYLHVPFWTIGASGHASPDDLNRLVELVSPEILFPLHSAEPDRMIPPPGTMRWLPQRGRVFPLSGRGD